MKRHDEHDPCLEQRVLLEAAMPPLPLAEDRIQATLRVAQRQLQQRRARNRIFAVVGAMTFLATLAAASFWRWDGEDSDAGLTFRASIAITRGEEDYSGTNVQTSAGKIGQDITRMLSRLIDRGALTDDIKAAMLEALDSPAPIVVPYQRARPGLAAGPRSDPRTVYGLLLRANPIAPWSQLGEGAAQDRAHRDLGRPLAEDRPHRDSCRDLRVAESHQPRHQDDLLLLRRQLAERPLDPLQLFARHRLAARRVDTGVAAQLLLVEPAAFARRVRLPRASARRDRRSCAWPS
jgi:hypothetical protein